MYPRHGYLYLQVTQEKEAWNADVALKNSLNSWKTHYYELHSADKEVR